MASPLNGKSPYNKLLSLPEQMDPASSKDTYDLVEDVVSGAIDPSSWSPKKVDFLKKKIEKGRESLRHAGWLEKVYHTIRHGSNLAKNCETALQLLEKRKIKERP